MLVSSNFRSSLPQHFSNTRLKQLLSINTLSKFKINNQHNYNHILRQHFTTANMVYSNSPKLPTLASLASTAGRTGAMSTLPDECLLQILKDVPAPDVLKLRLACRNVEPACNTVFSERLKTLYIHPSRMESALAICAHPEYSRRIEEVVLLGKVRNASSPRLNLDCSHRMIVSVSETCRRDFEKPSTSLGKLIGFSELGPWLPLSQDVSCVRNCFQVVEKPLISPRHFWGFSFLELWLAPPQDLPCVYPWRQNVEKPSKSSRRFRGFS